MRSALLFLTTLAVFSAVDAKAQQPFRNVQNFGGEFSFEVATTFTITTGNVTERIIAGGNNNGQGIKFFSNLGNNGIKTQSFRDKTSVLASTPIGANIVHLQSPDLNGDGFSDLLFRTKNAVLGTSAPAEIGYALFDPAQGRFQAQIMLPTIDAGTPAVSDINNDGRLDIVLADRTTAGTGAGNANINAFIQGTTGTFTVQTLSSLGSSYLPSEILVGPADYDNDGDRDIMFVQYLAAGFGFDAYIRVLENSSGVFTNNFIGSFPSIRVEKIVVTDFDNNGVIDALLTLTNSSIFTGTFGVTRYFRQGAAWNNQTLLPSQTALLPSARAMELLDYNGDGRTDLLFAGATDSISLFAQTATGTFTNVSSTTFPSQTLLSPLISTIFRIAPPLLVADFNSDLAPDIVLPRALHSGVVLAGNGTNFFDASASMGFSQSFPVSTQESIKSTCFGKLSPNGVIDAVMIGQSSIFSSRSDGSGVFEANSQVTISLSNLSPSDSVLVDFDGDGDEDLVVAGQPNDVIFNNNGSGIFSPSTATLNSTSSLVKTADFDSDGRADLFLGGFQSASVVLNTIQGLLTIQVPVSPGFTVVKAEIADLDGIPGKEIGIIERDATASSNAAIITVDLTNQTAQRTLTSPGILDLSLGDFNGDGVSDILAVPTSSSQPFILSTASGYNPAISFSGAKISVAGDLTGDGAADFILMSDSAAALFVNSGQGTFQQLPFDANVTRPQKLDLKDLDFDGDIDLIVTGETARGLRPRFLANLTRQFQMSSYARIGASTGTSISGTVDSATSGIAFLFASLDQLSSPMPTPWGELRLTNFVAGPNLLLTTPGVPVSFTFPLPYTPSLIGGQMTLQVAYLDFSGGLRLSNGQSIKLIN